MTPVMQTLVNRMKMVQLEMNELTGKIKNIIYLSTVSDNKSISHERSQLMSAIRSSVYQHPDRWQSIEINDNEHWETVSKTTLNLIHDTIDPDFELNEFRECFNYEHLRNIDYYHVLSSLMAVKIGDTDKIKQYLQSTPEKIKTIISLTQEPILILILPAVIAFNKSEVSK